MDTSIIIHIFFEVLLTGFIYSALAIGINFILNVVKIINWAMGGFYLIGAYIQYSILTYLFGVELWWLAILLSMATVFSIGALYQKFMLKPMYSERGERRTEYATVATIITGVLIRNLFAFIVGPRHTGLPSYWERLNVFGIYFDGNKIIALVVNVLLITFFYFANKTTWIGKALRACAQNRLAAESSGVDLRKFDQIAFGIGVALAASAGALLANIFPLTATAGKVSTTKGFEIIVIGGVGSITGSLVGGILLSFVESVGSLLLSASFRDIYGFVFMLLVLLVRPYGLFGEKQREV